MVPNDLKYTTEHEWLKVEDATGTVGITDYAQQQLGDVTFVEVPEIGKMLSAGDEACAIESAKAASSVYSPADGKVVAVNESLQDNPALVNEHPFDQGWIFKIELTNPDQLDGLMDAAAYQAHMDES
jgi:glycine cleavage system H protein